MDLVLLGFFTMLIVLAGMILYTFVLMDITFYCAKSREYVRGDYVCGEVNRQEVSGHLVEVEQDQAIIAVEWRDLKGGQHWHRVRVPYQSVKPGKKVA